MRFNVKSRPEEALVKFLVVVKAGKTNEGGIRLNGHDGEALKHLAANLFGIFRNEEVYNLDLFYGISRPETLTADALQEALRFGEARALSSLTDEAPFRQYTKTIEAIGKHVLDSIPDALIVVTHGEMADRLATEYGRRALGLSSLEYDENIVETGGVLLDIDKGTIARVY